MATICDRVGFEDIMQGFDFYMDKSTPDAPLYYSIWNGAKLKYISKEADPDSAKNEFESILKVWQRNGTGGMLEARFHEKRPSSQLSNKSDYEGSMTFKLRDNDLFPAAPASAQSGVAAPVNAMSSFLEQYQAFLQMQTLLQPVAEVSGDGRKDIWDIIEGLLSRPIVEDVVVGLSEKLGLNMAHYKRDQAMAGDADAMDIDEINDTNEQRLRRALERLLKGDDDFVNVLERLADLQEQRPKQYKMAKKFL